jgi:hypothetical protein
VKSSLLFIGSRGKQWLNPMAQAKFLTGLGIGAVFGLLLTARMRKRTQGLALKRLPVGADRASFMDIDGHASQIIETLKEHCNEAENRLETAMADFSATLLSLRESEEHWARGFIENQGSVTADLRRLRVLVTWTIILSCFGVVSFAIVLFLAYVKF